MYLYSIVIALLLTFHFFPIYNVYRDRIVHFVTERSDPVKKYNCLLALLVSVFLLLCACARQQSSQASSDPDTLSSTPSSSIPASSVPATSVPAYSVPATSIPATAPSTAPTQPAIMPTHQLTIPTMDWVTDRQIIPFEDRFKEDVPFGYYPKTWIAPEKEHSYSDYSEFYLWGLSVAMENGMEREFVYNIPVDPNLSAGFSWIAADGRWGYWLSDNELCKLDLLTGELTTLDVKNEGAIRWEVKACGKDTVCIFRLDAQRNLRIYYRDLHSEAEKTLYEGILPDVPTSENELFFYAPTTTQGDVYWEMINPAFYEIYLKELNSPVDDLKDTPNLRSAIQRDCGIPMLVRYSCDFNTGTLTADFGWYDTCWQTKDCKHDHFNYENTKEEAPIILDVAPVEIPDIGKPAGDDIWYEADTALTYIYSEFGYGQPYLILDASMWKLADFAVTQTEISSHFVYFITTEGTIVQFDYKDRICKTIYTSENKLSELFWCTNYDDIDYLYFVDGNTIVCIDTIAGTYRPIIQTNLDEIFIIGEEYIYYPRDLYFGVRQGLYYK